VDTKEVLEMDMGEVPTIDMMEGEVYPHMF
jgi:hypothetical protein